MSGSPTYELVERIHASRRSTIYRAHRREDGRSVVLKALAMDRPSADDAARFRREYEILKGLAGSGTVDAFGFEPVDDRPTIIMQDGGESLRALLAARRFGLEEGLELAIRAAVALDAIHRQGVVHKDIKPANLVVDVRDGSARFVDFGIATRLTRERPSVRSANVIEGTLLYMSPEQTGRTNRDIDSRSDLYSLGVVLYELFTGVTPFHSADPVELLHHHIARAPVPPHERAPEIPAPLSAVILKLLAKTAEERYQSAVGLRSDLEDVLRASRAAGPGGAFVVPWTAPGSKDAFDRFQIPQKLYGRESAAESILETYTRASRGRAELLLVGGYSGIGKSALVNELHRPVVARRGYFAGGKFDQLRREVPYASLVQAFASLVRQILTESDARLALFRARIAEALSHNGKLLTDLIPELAAIIGRQPEVPPLPPAEARNRFNFTFVRFVRALAAQEHPLVLFLDDLQWADLSSLKLVELLLGDPSVGRLLIIGAYRDNEVQSTHAMRLMQGAVAKAGARVSEILLQPLTAEDVGALVADALHCDPARSDPLARLCHERTAGNPFFLGQFLRALHEDRLISFDPTAGAWSFDLERIAARSSTENVLDLMASAIQRLDPAARTALELGAAIGDRFDVATLAVAAARSPEDVVHDLADPLAEGLVLPLDDGLLGSASGLTLKFLHDGVRQAAYARIAPAERRDIHRRLGRLLLEATTEARIGERIFEIVNHLNLGLDERSSAEERLEAARLNLLAAEKARASSAGAPALHYARTGISQLPPDAFRASYELARDLHTAAMVAEYANADFDALGARAELLLAEARTPLEKSLVYETRIYASTARAELQLALENGARALGLLGIDLPSTMDFPRFLEGLAVTRGLLAGRSAGDLASLPVTASAEPLAAMRVFTAIASTAYLINPLLSLHIYTEMFNLCLRHGLSEFAPFAFAVYGLINSAVLGDLDTGYAYGNVALQLADQHPSPRVRGRANVQVGLFLRHWKEHLETSLPLLFEAVGACLEGGDLEYVGYAAIGLAMYSFFVGQPLDEVAQEDARLIDLLRRNGLTYAEECVRACRQAVLDLRGRAGEEPLLEGEEFRESVSVPGMIAVNNASTLSLFHILKLILQYVFDDVAGAAATAEKGEAFVSAQLGQVAGIELNFFQSLALLALARDATGPEKEAMVAKVEKNQEAMKRWAEHAPMNSRHRFQLVEAERARLRGDPLGAIALFDDATSGAAEHGYACELAIAHELTAELYFSIGKERAGRAALAEASHAYAAWGAAAKVEQLNRLYPFLARRSSAEGTISPTITTTGSHGDTLIDARTVMKAAAVISSEIVLDKLLDKVMEIAIENAGAERGLLILAQGGRLSIAAERAVRPSPVAHALPAPVEGSHLLSPAIVHYAARTQEPVVLDDAAAEGLFAKDPYVTSNRSRSVLCAPLINQGRLVALVYLENNLTAGAFTADRLELLRMLSVQAALSIQNAELFASVAEHSRTLEHKVEERTRELSQKNDELSRTLIQLRDAQRRLVVQEKLASLGALTAGIAHEIKNPLNFVNNFAELSSGMTIELGEILSTQRGRLDPGVADEVAEALATLRSNVLKINEHGRRANEIVNAMLLHTREKGGRDRVEADINDLVKKSVELAYHAARGKDSHLQVRIDAAYDDALGPVEISSSEIGRVIINVVDNACYALSQQKKLGDAGYAPALSVRTGGVDDRVEIRVRDNGTGIPAAIVGQVFDPFFTTKPPGEGAGLGLSLSHDIVLGHGGEMQVESKEGEYTEIVVTLPRRQRGRGPEAGA